MANATAKNGIPPLVWIQWLVRKRMSTKLAKSVIVTILKAFLTTVIGKMAIDKMTLRDKVPKNK